MPNERRAWFHARLGELAFAAGDTAAALQEEKTALERFPDDLIALTDAARFSAAAGAWNDARAYAARAVQVTPSPENLGLLADAQERLGDPAAAAATRDEIVAVERIGNAQHLVDRLLAVYYADHGVRLAAAYAIARRDLAVRDDVFAEDTLAWTAARAGAWDVARAAARKATAYGTAEPRLWYHAGVDRRARRRHGPRARVLPARARAQPELPSRLRRRRARPAGTVVARRACARASRSTRWAWAPARPRRCGACARTRRRTPAPARRPGRPRARGR